MGQAIRESAVSVNPYEEEEASALALRESYASKVPVTLNEAGGGMLSKPINLSKT